jgi:peptide/nickel transport system permease protein
MLRYVLQRLLLAIPTLLLISLAVFGLNQCAPGDPVESRFGNEALATADPFDNKVYQLQAAELGLDKPLFYFSVTTAIFPDTLWKIYPQTRRTRLSRLTAQNGDWAANVAFERTLQQITRATMKLPDSLTQKQYLYLALNGMMNEYRLERLAAQLMDVDSLVAGMAPALQSEHQQLREKIQPVLQSRQTAAMYLPAVHWYGFNNQYHHWIKGFLTGNMGLTLQKRPVWQELKPAMYASMSINLLAIFFAYLIAVPLGVEMARRPNKAFDRWAQRFLLFLHAMPVFWLGALLVMLFCSPILGKPLIQNPYLDISDAWQMNSEPFLTWFGQKLHKFSLPILVLTLYSLTTIALQMRGSMLENVQQDYVRTARAKGVPEDQVYWTHALRNALFPIITLFGSVFPSLFTGSLVLETLFNFPGMGQKTQTAFHNHDLVVLSAILMMAAVLAVLGNLIADLLYAVADPRVRFATKK